MICKLCGAQIDDNSTECKFCGAVLKEADEADATKVIDTEAIKNAETHAPGEAEDMAEEPEQTMGVQEEDDTEELFDENEKNRRIQIERMKAEKQHQLDEIERRRSAKKRKQRRNRIIAIVVAILVIGAIGGGIYYIGQNSGGDTEIIVENTTPAPHTEAPEETEAPSDTPVPETEAPSETVSGGDTGGSAAAGGTSSGSSQTGGNRDTSSGSSQTGGNRGTSSGSSQTGGNRGTSSGSSQTAAARVTPAPTAAPTAVPQQSAGTDANGYVISDSSTRLLTEADLTGKTAYQLRIARNEIYARHGRTFKDRTLQAYFDGCSWYRKNSAYNYANDAANLTRTEQKNVKFIREYELSH